MIASITNVEEASRVLEAYAGFHDSIISALEITLKDELSIRDPANGIDRGDDAITHIILGQFDVKCRFICPVFDGNCSRLSCVEAMFYGVDEISIDFRVPRGGFVPWTLNTTTLCSGPMTIA
jgi:hypothetical protein